MFDVFQLIFMPGSKLKSARRYFYRLLSGPESLSIFERDRAWHVPEELDLLAMQEACKVLVGHHDFSSFRAAGCQAKSPMRTLDELDVSEVVSNPYFPSILKGDKMIKPRKIFMQAPTHLRLTCLLVLFRLMIRQEASMVELILDLA